MPKAGMDMEEGKLIRWLKEIGDPVEKDEPIMEIETDKITMEAESPGSGYLLAKLAAEGSTVPVLQVIAYIGEKGEAVPDALLKSAAEDRGEAVSEKTAVPDSQPGALSAAGSRPAATPYARKLASENNIELSQISASGPKGEIVSRDILSATPLAKRIAEDKGIALSSVAGSGHNGKIRKEDVLSAYDEMAAERVPLSSQRKVIAKRMHQSHTEIPAVTQHMKVYADNLLELRRQLNMDREDKISVNDLIIKIVAIALREHPVFRSRLDGDYLTVMPDVNIGFAVGMDDGLLVPVVRHADLLSLSAISSQTKELIDKARGGSLRKEDMTGGCFTITNLGMYGMFAFTPIINQPEAAILGVNAVHDELYLDGETPKKRSYMMVSLAYDHRIVDGVGASKFEMRIKELLENPLQAVI